MRRAFLPILPLALLLLVAGTWLAWQHRFEIDPAHPHLTLRDLGRDLALESGVSWETDASGAPELVLDVGTASRPVVQVLSLPLSKPVRFLMFDFAVQAQGLKAGEKTWSDGRLMIEWHSADGSMEPQYLVSARGNDPAGTPCVVVRPAHGPAVPVLRVEHLGSSGSFHLRHCRIFWARCRFSSGKVFSTGVQPVRPYGSERTWVRIEFKVHPGIEWAILAAS